MKPSFTARKPLPLAEHSASELSHMITASNSYVRRYSLGECSVIVTREYGKWHLSIAHPSRHPTWNEIAEARYRILPKGITAAMLLPPLEEYVNLHSHCFQVFEISDPARNSSS